MLYLASLSKPMKVLNFCNNFMSKEHGWRSGESACPPAKWPGFDFQTLLCSPLGLVSRKSRKLFGPEKPFVKLPTACFRKPIFKHVFKATKRKTTEV